MIKDEHLQMPVEWTDEQVAYWKKRDQEVRAQQEAEAAANRKRRALACREDWTTFDAPARHKEILEAGKLATTGGIEAMRTWTDGVVVLSGGTGCGKTLAAVDWLRRWVVDPQRAEKADNAKFVTAHALSRVDRWDDEEVNSVLGLTRLVVDDLGAEVADSKGYFLALVDELVDAFYTRKRGLVITTNLDAARFAERYGLRVVDRIREHGRIVACGAKSLRGAR